MQDYKVIFGNNVRKYRILKHLSQEQLGGLVEMQQSAVGRIERAQSNTTFHNMIKLSNALGVEMSSLFRNEEPESISAYLPDLNLEQLPDEKKRFTNTLLKLIFAITNEEIDNEVYETLFQQITKAVRYTKYELIWCERELDHIVTYGIKASQFMIGKVKRVEIVPDISTNSIAIKELVDRLNHQFASMEHFRDILDDFLAGDCEL